MYIICRVRCVYNISWCTFAVIAELSADFLTERKIVRKTQGKDLAKILLNKSLSIRNAGTTSNWFLNRFVVKTL